MKHLRQLAFYISLFVFTACSYSTYYLQTGSQKFPSTAPADVQMFSGKPGRSFKVIGAIAADVVGDVDDCQKAIKKKAASIGADAVIFIKLSVFSTAGARMGINGVAVKFIE
jgi:hypothetical protein